MTEGRIKMWQGIFRNLLEGKNMFFTEHEIKIVRALVAEERNNIPVTGEDPVASYRETLKGIEDKLAKEHSYYV